LEAATTTTAAAATPVAASPAATAAAVPASSAAAAVLGEGPRGGEQAHHKRGGYGGRSAGSPPGDVLIRGDAGHDDPFGIRGLGESVRRRDSGPAQLLVGRPLRRNLTRTRSATCCWETGMAV
jgi:hypothetical protein